MRARIRTRTRYLPSFIHAMLRITDYPFSFKNYISSETEYMKPTHKRRPDGVGNKQRRNIPSDIGRSVLIFIPSAIPGWAVGGSNVWMSDGGDDRWAAAAKHTAILRTGLKFQEKDTYLAHNKPKTNGVWTNRKALTEPAISLATSSSSSYPNANK